MAKNQEKRPFDRLVGNVSPDLLQRPLGRRQEGAQGFTFDRDMAKIRMAVKSGLHCDLDKFGSSLGLSAKRVSELISAGEGDSGKQIDYILLAWVESLGEQATLEALLRTLYAADDTRAVESVAKTMGESGADFQRDVLTHNKKLNFPDSVGIMPSPPVKMPPQKHFLENDEMELSQRLARLSMKTNMVPQRPQSESEQTPVELPPDVSLQRPLEESLKNITLPIHPSTSDEEEEEEEEEEEGEEDSANHDDSAVSEVSPVTVAVEESRSRPSTVVTASTMFENPQHVAAAVSDATFEEKHGHVHEMVSGDRRMERMQSDIEDLRKNMTRMETDVADMKIEHRRESLHYSAKSKEWELKLRHLEEDNQSLLSTVADLREELQKTNQRLQEALEQVATLTVDNELLKQRNQTLEEERAKILKENEQLHKKVADTERENAEFQDALEEQNKKMSNIKERYELELREKNAMIEEIKKEKRRRGSQDAIDSPLDNGHQLQTLQRSDKWIIWKKQLGAGGYGEVFLAQRQGSSECFAAKRMTFKDSATIEKQSEMMTAFAKEMKALQECKHARVVQYVDRYVDSEESAIHFYIIMEYMSQGSLADLMKREGKLDEVRAKKYTRQLLEGLKYLHRRSPRVIHRDIKCSNILLDDNGDIKLADFGCVKFSGSKVSSGEHMTGTAWWMAPELVKGKQSGEASEKSDVWSVGATVVEMLTGKRPFYEYEEKMAVIFGLGMGKLSLDKLIHGPGFSDEVQEFLRLCINWEPSQRATVDDLLATAFCALD